MMRQPIKAWILGLLLAAVVPLAAADTRFTNTLPPEERKALGIDQLSSDQLAILDALVRRDAAQQAFEEPEGPTFTARLTEAELKNAGLADLEPVQRERLDAAVASHQAAAPRASLLSHPVFLPRTSIAGLRPIEKKPQPEVHGSITLSYGWGDGYSTRSGSVVVNMTDPSKKYSVTIGYGETHVKAPPGTAVLLDPHPPYHYDRGWLRP